VGAEGGDGRAAMSDVIANVLTAMWEWLAG
jgi:hypothetical protein